MPLKALKFQPGVKRDITRYAAENAWYDCDKVRFVKGFPRKIGGWQLAASTAYVGVCRSIFTWASLGGAGFAVLGTSKKVYVMSGDVLYDITPLRDTTAAGDVTFDATNGSSTLTVTDVGHGASVGDYVTFSGAVSLGGNITAGVLNAEYSVTDVLDADNYQITAAVTANGSDVGNGGAAVVAAYQISIGLDVQGPLSGWGSGSWGSGSWGIGTTGDSAMRVWRFANYGEDLLMCIQNGPLYFWDLSAGTGQRAVLVEDIVGASNVPTVLNNVLVSDTSRFVLAFGPNELLASGQDPMLLRWSDQENYLEWTPSSLNQAGDIRLSSGSRIVAAVQMRQEIIVLTDFAIYSLQYVGPPVVWSPTLLAENISIVSDRAVAVGGAALFWMGNGQFYVYDGSVRPLVCDVRDVVFDDINPAQFSQVFTGSVREFNEVWWFYCSAESSMPDRYVCYNYVENVWTYGTMDRTAWEDSGVFLSSPMAVNDGLVLAHETGCDDNSTDAPQPIEAYIRSAEFDLDDGDRFAFVRRVLPDVDFTESTAPSPAVAMTLYPLKNSGSGVKSPRSANNASDGPVVRSASGEVQEFTQQLNLRVRGRQIMFEISSDALGVAWSLGVPRIDVRPDGQN